MKSTLTVLILSISLFTNEVKPLLTFKNSEEIFKIVEKFLPVNPIIIEAGAYNGKDSVLMAKRWTGGKIYSFEPIPDIYETLLKKTKNIKNIKAFQLAIGQKIGLVDMHISEHSAHPGKTFASSSLLPPKEHLTYAPHIKFPRTIKVLSSTFDAWAKKQQISHVDFMWLDMQGYELNALKASPKTLETAKVILTEVLFIEAYKGQYLYKDIKQWLESKGFELIALDRQHGWFGDAIFVKKNLL